MQLAGAEAGKPACMALLSAFEAGRQPRLAMQVERLSTLTLSMVLVTRQLPHQVVDSAQGIARAIFKLLAKSCIILSVPALWEDLDTVSRVSLC